MLRATLLLTSLLVLASADFGHSAERPHIVFILADDLGYGDLKAYNPDSKIATPHLDQLAASGMTFTDAHSGGSTCTPSRFSLFSGQFNPRAENLSDRVGPLLPEGKPTIASLLRDQGYDTAMVGKWHLGFDQKGERTSGEKRSYAFDFSQPLTGGPLDRGFKSLFGMHASLDIPPYFFIRDRTPVHPPSDFIDASDSEDGQEGWNRIQGAFWREGPVAPNFVHEEVTPRFADEACKVIANHDLADPLFLYLALPSPHTPWLPLEAFRGKSQAGMYGDFVMQVDYVVGQVMTALEESEIASDTLLLFSSDNGPVWYEKDAERFDHRSTGNLRGAKGSVWEGGHRVPFLARWPGRVPADTTNDALIAFADVFATFAELTGAAESDRGTATDSVSFLSTLLDPERPYDRAAPILHSGKVIRDGDWKLIDTQGRRGFTAEKGVKYGIELFNLPDDPSEENNLATDMPEKVESLRRRMADLLDD